MRTVKIPNSTISSIELQNEASEAIDRGEEVQYERFPYAPNLTLHVETIVIGDRAGQAVNAAAIWGDWDADSKTLTTDDGETYDLVGRVVQS